VTPLSAAGGFQPPHSGRSRVSQGLEQTQPLPSSLEAGTLSSPTTLLAFPARGGSGIPSGFTPARLFLVCECSSSVRNGVRLRVAEVGIADIGWRRINAKNRAVRSSGNNSMLTVA